MLFILGVMKPSQSVCECTDVHVIEYGDMEGRSGRQTSMSGFFFLLLPKWSLCRIKKDKI
jgi:hypothetical protein